MALCLIPGGNGEPSASDLLDVARWVMAHDDLELAPDAFRFAWICDLSFRVKLGEPELCGSWVCYDATRSELEQQKDVACCVAEWALRTRGFIVTDFAVQSVARSLMRPRSQTRLRVVG